MANTLPEDLKSLYFIREYRHAITILEHDFPDEYADIVEMLRSFRLNEQDIIQPGGRKSPISGYLDEYLYTRGWEEKGFDTKISIDGQTYDTPTHKIDCYKNHVALDIEWNNKDPFYDRDLNNYRILHDRQAISLAIILTRTDELQDVFNSLGKGSSYGASTTHMSKLLPRIEGGSGGGCPILVVGITKRLFVAADGSMPYQQ